jgi:hypothetical protein
LLLRVSLAIGARFPQPHMQSPVGFKSAMIDTSYVLTVVRSRSDVNASFGFAILTHGE